MIKQTTPARPQRTVRFSLPSGLRPAVRVGGRVAVAAVLTAAASLAGLATAPTAEAGAYAVAYTNGDGVALRSTPTASDFIRPIVTWRDGTAVTIICQAWSSDAVGPRANHIFDRVAYPARGGQTWIPDAYVSGTAAANQYTTGIARCAGTSPAPTGPSSSAADKAIGWMTARKGSTAYDGQCLAAVYQAYLAAGRNITAGLPSGPSHDSAYTYWTVAKNKHPGDHNVPRGALVFFRSASGAPGHVAIGLGNGQMISTYDGRTHAIHTMAISSYDPSRFLGWVGI